MDLRPTGSDRLLEIKTDCVTFMIKGKRRAYRGAGEKENSILVVKGVNVKDILVNGQSTIVDKQDGATIRQIQISPMFFEQTYYEIIAGERRWRAAKRAGLKEVPVIIKNLTEQEIVEISLIENIQREDLNPIEEAQAYKRLLTEFNLKQDEVAERVAKSRTAVTNSMRLLKLCDNVQQMIIDGMISTGHARALISIEDPEQQYTVAQQIFDEKLSVRDVEKLVKNLNQPPKVKKAITTDKSLEAVYQNIEENLKQKLSTKVSITPKGNGTGKIEIEFYSHEDLEKLMDLLSK